MQAPFKPQLIALLISSSISSAAMAEESMVKDNFPVQTTGFVAALKLAMQHDPELKFAFYNYQAGQEQDDLALSQLLPNVSLESSYNYSVVDNYYTSDDYKPTSEDLIERTKDEQSDYVTRISLKQSLVNVAAWQAYSSSKEAVRQSKFTYTRAEQELIYRLSQAYLENLLAAQQVYITQEKLESLQLKLDQTSRMNELGVGGRLNVLRATSSRDVARSDLLQAKSNLEDAQNKLENITGSHVDIPKDWVANSHLVLPNLTGGTEEDWIDKIQDNASILAEMANVRSKELEADSSSSQHLPTLSLSLTYSDRNSDDVYVESTNSTASINFSMPIYSGGRTSAQARQAEAGYHAAQAKYEKTLSDTQQAVRLAVTQLNSYRERLQALEESRKSSQAFLEAAERQADLSLGSQVDVLEARTELYDVRLQFAQTLSDYLLADLNLLLETGQLNDQTLARYDQLFDNNTHL
ncbi:TolC family protein [Marinomonas fungiae]|uniref:TolC family protein n=1 Tax=Marinomonas fungiae TaxID=1137284 RepID=UPI003A907DEB